MFVADPTVMSDCPLTNTSKPGDPFKMHVATVWPVDKKDIGFLSVRLQFVSSVEVPSTHSKIVQHLFIVWVDVWTDATDAGVRITGPFDAIAVRICLGAR